MATNEAPQQQPQPQGGPSGGGFSISGRMLGIAGGGAAALVAVIVVVVLAVTGAFGGGGGSGGGSVLGYVPGDASYQIVIEGTSYRERLSPHRALLSNHGGD